MQNQESLLLFRIDTKDAELIRRLAGNMRIKVTEVPESQFSCTLEDICDGRAGDLPVNSNVSEGAAGGRNLLVFANVTDKHMDKILFELRSRQIAVDYKAVMTQTNRAWNIHRLMFEMEKERKAYQGR